MPETKDPETNFEVLWHTFNENYAFFKLYDVDWQAQYDKFRPQVTAKTKEDELFEIMSNMLAPLEDAHISLLNPDGLKFYSPSKVPKWINKDYIREARKLVIKQMKEEAKPSNDFVMILFHDFLRVIKENYLKGDATEVCNGKIFYGKLNPTTGYINILSMSGYANSPLEERKVVAHAIDQIIKQLYNLKTIIIDIRFNDGGEDVNSLCIASRFADQKRLAFSKQARNGSGFTPLREYYIEPIGDRQFTKKVILLTSAFTVSAAEIFMMAMTTLPHVTVIGEATRGAHSDVLNRHLPNGWEFGLSNEIYYTHGKQIYEKVGLPPDIEVHLNADDFKAGKDNILDYALKIAKEIDA